MPYSQRRYCINHLEASAEFYCQNCMKFLCSECVEDGAQENGASELCKTCGSSCMPSVGVIPPNITVKAKERKLTIWGSFLGLIIHPAETTDFILTNLTYTFLLTSLLPIYLVSLLIFAGPESINFPFSVLTRLFQQIRLLVFFVIFVEVLCRIARALEITAFVANENERITGLQYILGMLAGSMYVYSFTNILFFMLNYMPSSFVKTSVSFALGFWSYALTAFFVSQIYDIEFTFALVTIYLAYKLEIAASLFVFFSRFLKPA